MRDPSIHVKSSKLFEVLESLGFNLSKSDKEFILRECFVHRLRGRHIFLSNKKTILDKLLRDNLLETSEFELFNGLLSQIRKQNGHKYVRPIDTNSAQWKVLKNMTIVAQEYCETFGMTSREGMAEFIKIGLKYIGRNYAINKFKFYKEKIFSHKEVDLLVGSDVDKYMTFQIIEYYKSKAVDRGLDFEVDNIDELANFIYCKKAIMEAGADHKDWIDAQISELESMVDAFPNPNQLHGVNADKRYKSYLGKGGVKKKTSFSYLNIMNGNTA